MAAYAEASANFAALATHPDGFEEEAGDDDVPVQGIRSISLSRNPPQNFLTQNLFLPTVPLLKGNGDIGLLSHICRTFWSLMTVDNLYSCNNF